MSFIRLGSPLMWFKGKSTAYVFSRGDNKIEDYGDQYEDDATLVDLIGRFISRFGDEAYAEKIVLVLARKLKIQNKLRGHKMTFEEWSEEVEETLANWKEEKQ